MTRLPPISLSNILDLTVCHIHICFNLHKKVRRNHSIFLVFVLHFRFTFCLSFKFPPLQCENWFRLLSSHEQTKLYSVVTANTQVSQLIIIGFNIIPQQFKVLGILMFYYRKKRERERERDRQREKERKREREREEEREREREEERKSE